MKVKVIGKRHMEGTSKKTGNPYNMNEVHYIGHNPDVVGQSAETCVLNAVNYPFDSITVGADYNVEFNRFGRPVDFTLISSPSGK